MAERTVSVRLMADIGSYVAGMSKASAATLSLGNAATASSAQAKGGFDIASKGALLMGGAVVAGLGMAISRAADFDQSMSRVQAATRASASDLEDLRAAAMRAGADTAFSAGEAAQGITELAKAGVSTADILKGGLNGALSLAAAGELEVGAAAEIAASAMTQFSLSGDQLPHVADLLAAGAGKAQGSVQDMGAALNQAGLIASAAGLSIEETTGGLAAFASAGLIGSDAGTSFKTMLQAIQAPSGKSAELMEELGINAYDAGGNFIGLAGLAGVLQEKLSGLTQEQRNAAIAQIFGSDAARAANVLYQQGAEGIASWTAKVNDAGYAAQEAAIKQDNLRGDLEKLGGAFDRLMLALGEGAQGPLRGLVQMFTGIVDVGVDLLGFWQSLPGPIQAGVAALGALALLNGPLSGVLGTMRGFGGGLAANVGGTVRAFGEALSYARANGDGLGTVLGSVGSYAAGGFRSAISGVIGAFGGPWGLAITGATVGLSYLVSSMGQSDQATQKAKTAQEGFAQALRESNGAITENVRQTAAKSAQDTGLLDVASRAGISLSRVTDAITGQSGALVDVRAQLQQYVNQQTTTVVDANGQVTTSLTEEGRAAQAAMGSLGGLAGQVGATSVEQRQLASATQSSDSAMASAQSTAEAFAAQMDAAEAQIDETKKATDRFKLSLDILTGTNVTAIEVESAFQDALDAAKGSLEGLDGSAVNAAGSLDLNSESGRRAADVLLDVRNSGNDLIATLKQQGATEEEVRRRDAELRSSFIETARQMGFTGRDADRLADQILGIPDRRNTTITADTGPASSRIDELLRRYNGAEVQVRARQTPGFAHGGWTGPGSKYQPAGIVHADEFVVPKERVNALGGPRAVGSLVGMPGYAAGGPVSPIALRVTADTSSLAGSLERIANAPAGGGAVPGRGGSLGSNYSQLFGAIKAAFPQARLNSGFRPGDPGYHGRGKAADIGLTGVAGGAGNSFMARVNQWLYDNHRGSLAELIYNGLGDNRPNVKNSRDFAYSAGTQAQHRNHVHAAVYDQGGPLYPGLTMAYNGTGKTEWVSRSREQNMAYTRSREVGGFGPGGLTVVVQAAPSPQPARTGPVMNVERQYVNSGVDLELVLRQAAFRERMGAF